MDDNKINRMVISRMFKALGLMVVTATSSENGIPRASHPEELSVGRLLLLFK